MFIQSTKPVGLVDLLYMKKENSTGSEYFPKILSVGTAVPDTSFTQTQIADMLKVKSEKARRFFVHEHIQKRHLALPEDPKEETNHALLERFRLNAVKLSVRALKQALSDAKLDFSQLDYLCCVTSTGFIVPSLSMHIIAEMGLKNTCQRVDVVGMGCSAGLNGLAAVYNWCRSNQGKIGALICCEISSAIYVMNDDENSALVNSLFGDGVAVAILGAGEPGDLRPAIKKFTSFTIGDSLHALRFDWNSEKNLNQFYVGKETPQLMGEKMPEALKNLLGSVSKNEIRHWIVHTGGSAILNKIEEILSLGPTDLRHSRSILKNYGNISSGSFLFSLKSLFEERSPAKGEKGVMITMGPGLAIEMALIEW